MRRAAPRSAWHRMERWRPRAGELAPLLERWLPAAFAALLLAFFVIRDHDLLRHVFYAAVALPLVLSVRRDEALRLARSPILMAAGGYLLHLWLSTFWSSGWTARQALELLLHGLGIAAFLAATVVLATRDPAFPERLLRWLAWLAGAVALVALLWFYSDHRFPKDRVEGFGLGGYPTRAAMLYGVAFIAAVYGGLRDAASRRQQVLYTGIACATAVFITFAQSRGVMVGLGATIVLGALVLRQRLLLLGLAAVVTAGLAIQMADLVDSYDLLRRGTTLRTMVWGLALERAAEAPWYGFGTGEPQTFLLWGHMLILHPHNVVLAHYLAGGVPAALLLFLLVGLAARAAWRDFRRTGSYLLLALLVFVAVVGMVDFSLFLKPLDIEWLFFWLPIGLAAAVEVRAGAAPCALSRPS